MRFRMVCGLVLLFASAGCRSAYYTRYLPPCEEPYEAGAGIAGLPLLKNGAPLTAEARGRHEAEIDQTLGGIWTSRYSSITHLRQEHPALMEAWRAGAEGNCNLETRLRVNADLCAKLQEASGCRYAVVPTYGAASWSDVHMLAVTYVIPIPPMIIFGTVPVRISERPGTRVPAFTMSLVDLEQRRVLAEEVMTVGKDFDPATSPYPLKLLREMAPLERRLSVAKVKK